MVLHLLFVSGRCGVSLDSHRRADSIPGTGEFDREELSDDVKSALIITATYRLADSANEVSFGRQLE